MKNTITRLLAAFAMGAMVQTTNAQHAIGLQSGNHNASYAYALNPSQTYPDKNRFYLNLWGSGIGYTNNFLTYSAPFSLWAWGTGNYPDSYKDAGGNLKFDQSWLQLDGDKDHWRLYYLDETYGPSVHFRVDRKNAIGFGVKSVAGLSVNGVNRNLGNLFRFGLDSNSAAFSGPNGAVIGQEYNMPRFSVNTDKWQEWFFSYAWVARDKGRHFVKWGATGKFLLGMGAAHVGAADGSYRFNDKNELQLNNMRATYFHTGDASASTTLSSPFGLKFNDPQGAGLGMDIGFTYQYRPDRLRKTYRDWWNCADEEHNGYSWRFGASLTDLGFIGYGGKARMLDMTGSRTWTVNTDLVDNRNSFGADRFEKAGTGFFDSFDAEQSNAFLTTTPAAFNAQLDIKMGKTFYVGANWTHSLKGAYSWGVRRASYISVVPRWETEGAELGIPVTLTRDYTALNVGLYGRLGPFMLGTDNLGGLLNYASRGDHKAANIYFGVRIKLAACDWDYYHRHDKRDTVVKEVRNTDTLNFWRRDTIRLEKRDTVKVYRTDTLKIYKRDTVIRYKNTEITGDLKKKEDELRRREEELKKREAEIIKRENNNMGTGDRCCNEVIGLKRELEDERTANTRLRGQVDQCERDKDRLRAENDGLRRENETLRNTNASLKAEIDRLNSEIARLRLNNNPCASQVRVRDSLILVEQQKNATITAQLSKRNGEYDAIVKANDANKKRIAELEAELAACKANTSASKDCLDKVKLLEAQIAAEKARGDGLQKELNETKARLDAEVKKSAALQAELDACKKSAENDKKRIAELEAQLKNCGNCSTYQEKIILLEKQLADLRAEYDYQIKLTKELQEKLKNCGSAEELNKVKAELDAVKKRNAELEAEVADLKKQKETLNSEITAYKSKVADLEAKLKECQSKGSDCKACEEELEQYKLKYEQKSGAYDALMEEYRQCAKDLQALKDRLATCESKLKECSGSSGNEETLKAEIDKLKRTIAELNAEVAARQKSLDELQDAYGKLEEKNSTLSKQLASQQLEINGLKAQLATLQEQLKQCQEGVK